MDCRDKIILQVADKEVERISRAVVSRLRRDHESMTSGDSGLKNLWDEYCVQTQGEHSLHFKLYEDHIRNLIRTELTKVPTELKTAIWLQTEAGIEWFENAPASNDSCTWEEEGIVEHIYSNIEKKSINYHNARIGRYLGF